MFQRDVLTGRTRVGPLGWVVIFIALLFVMACGLGAFALVTHNVASLSDGNPGEPAPVVAAAATNTPAPLPTVMATLPPTPTTIQTSCFTRFKGVANPTGTITWTAFVDNLPGLGCFYNAPPEIRAWVLRDYITAQVWEREHMFDQKALIEQAPRYRTGNALKNFIADVKNSFAHAGQPGAEWWAPLIDQPRQPPPMDKPNIEEFSQDGRRVRLTDYTGRGQLKAYNLKTRQLVPVLALDAKTQKLVPMPELHNMVWSYILEYDPKDKRWKIARLVEIYDVEKDIVFASNPE